MKVLIATGIYPPEIGGPSMYAHALAGELRRRGDAPVIVTYGDEKTARGEGWDVHAVSRSGGAVFRYFRYAWTVARLARDADLVYLQGAVSEGFPGTIGAALAGKPTIMRVPGDYAWEISQQSNVVTELLDEFLTHRHTGGIRLLEAIERWTSRRARRIIAPSRYLKSVLERWGVSEKKISVIVSTPPPLPEAGPRDAIRERLGLGLSYVVFTVVRAVPWKGVDFLIDVLKELPSDIILVVAGDGPCLEEWKRQASSLGSRVRFVGRVDRHELAMWETAADCFVLATGYEGFPHVIPEAAAAGLPCLVSDKGGNPETRELYPDHVAVLPYRDRDAWKKAIAARPSRRPPATLRSFSDVVTETRKIFESVCAS